MKKLNSYLQETEELCDRLRYEYEKVAEKLDRIENPENYIYDGEPVITEFFVDNNGFIL